jgi:hypothetical protein
MVKLRTFIGLGAVALALGIGFLAFNARSQERHFGPPFLHHGSGGLMGHGMSGGPAMMGMARDSATVEQLRVIHTLFINHDRITLSKK